jgi:hypothetical protein
MYELLLGVGVLAIIVLILGIIVAYVTWKKKEERGNIEPDYRTFFILGICFLPMGTIFMIIINPGFM